LSSSSHHEEDEEDDSQNKDDGDDNDDNDGPDRESSTVLIVCAFSEDGVGERTSARLSFLVIRFAIFLGARVRGIR